MGFDFRLRWLQLHDPGQLNEGGRNRAANCVPDACHECMEAITGQHIPPQSWTDYEYGTQWTGYTNLDKAVDFINKHYTSPPPMSIGNPDDTWAAVQQAGEMGEPCAVLFRINGSVEIGNYSAGYHCSVPVALVDGTYGPAMVVRNVWKPDWYQTLDRTTFAQACSGTNAGSMIRFGARVQSAGSTADPSTDYAFLAGAAI